MHRTAALAYLSLASVPSKLSSCQGLTLSLDHAAQVVVYLGEPLSGEELRKGALNSFNVELPHEIEVR